MRVLTERGRRRVAGWTGRRCGEADQETVRGTVFPPNGYTAIMPRAWRGCLTAGKACGFRALRLPRWRTSGPWVEAGPDPARDGVLRWRRQDLQRRIAEAFAGAIASAGTKGTSRCAVGHRCGGLHPPYLLSKWTSDTFRVSLAP